MKNRPEIDGLRAIAVLPVMLFHADLGCRGGYVGVDVFFVISGYLISRLLLEEIDSGRFSIVHFWERRVRRIMPAVAIVVLATLAAGWFLFLPLHFKQLGQSAAAQMMLVSNVYFWSKSGYFAQGADVKPLLHTWSLAVEEQFYLVFPFLLVALKRFAHRFLSSIILLLCALSFGLSVYMSHAHPSANFYFLPTRGWELLIGSFLAAISAPRPEAKWLKELLSGGGLIMIACAVLCYDRDTRFPGVAALLPCLGAALVIWSNAITLTYMGRLLAIRPLVFVGLISYSLYLWHWPMLVFSKYAAVGQFPPWQRSLVLVASVLFAALSWKFVENPFRKRVILKTRVQIFSFASMIAGVLFLAGLAIHRTQGLPSRFPPAALQYADGINDVTSRREMVLEDVVKGSLGELGIGDTHQPVKLVVWGDSHAMAVLPVLDVLCREHSVRGVAATHSATAPLLGFFSEGKYALGEDSMPFNDAVAAFIRREHVSDVLLAAVWSAYIENSDADEATNSFRRCMIATVRDLKNSGARIWLLKDVPRQTWDPPRVLCFTVLRGGDPEAIGVPLAEHRKLSQQQDLLFNGVAASGAAVLDPTPFFVNRANLCRVAEGGHALYWDMQHLTVHGAMLLRPLFEPIFEHLEGGQPRVADKQGGQ
jgi:peptidoglycan/LPS O-acetylase OafA/YrhL